MSHREMGSSLVVFPTAGLVNRLRVVASAHILSQDLNRKFYLNWEPAFDCNADWNDLFLNDFPVFPRDSAYFRAASRLYTAPQFSNFYLDMPLKIREDERSPIAIESCHPFQAASCVDFVAAKSDFYRSLRPVEEVEEKIRQFEETHDLSQMVGIHIRRSDLTTNKGWNPHAVSPIKDFVGKCRQLLDQRDVTAFFLATDSASDERILRRNFGSRIVTQPDRILRRDSKDGIQDALVDWLILSKTSFLIRSYYSSFSGEACVVNQIDSHVVLKERSASSIFLSDFYYSPRKKARALLADWNQKFGQAR